MKSIVITALLVIFLTPITAFAQEPLNNIIIESPQGSTSIIVTVDGDIQYDGQLVLSITGSFDSTSQQKLYDEYYTITADNPSHVFELDYPFRANEVYFLTAKNGPGGFSQSWIPYLVTESSTTGVLGTDLEQAQSSSVLISMEEGSKFESVRDENKLLSDEVQKKNSVLMEQIMVIKDLASQISNVMYTKSLDSISLTVGQVEPTTPKETFDDYVDYMSEENVHLSEEIEKKDAVLMEQLKVIQDLAAQVKNANFDKL